MQDGDESHNGRFPPAAETPSTDDGSPWDALWILLPAVLVFGLIAAALYLL